MRATPGVPDERPRIDGRWEDGAFDGVYQAHSRAVYAVACRVATPGLAEDLTQEVFLQLWRHPERYAPDRGSLRTFLLAVTHNLAVDAMRSESARRARELRNATRRDIPTPATGLDHRLLLDERRSIVDRELDRLNPRERVAIVTAYFGGCTYREVAVVLGLAEGTVKSRIRAGLRHLNAALGPSAESLDEWRRDLDHVDDVTLPQARPSARRSDVRTS